MQSSYSSAVFTRESFFPNGAACYTQQTTPKRPLELCPMAKIMRSEKQLPKLLQSNKFERRKQIFQKMRKEAQDKEQMRVLRKDKEVDERVTQASSQASRALSDAGTALRQPRKFIRTSSMDKMADDKEQAANEEAQSKAFCFTLTKLQ